MEPTKINKYIVETIEELRPLSNNLIDNNLRVNVPTKINFKYIRKGDFKDTHRILNGKFSIQDVSLLLTDCIPFNTYQYKPAYMDTLDNLIKGNRVYPFLFFVNGLFIKWSEIYIIKDCRYSYILLPGITEMYADYTMVMLPKTVIYNETGLCSDKTLFSFKNGYYYSGIDRCVTIDTNDSCDFYYEEKMLETNTIQHFEMNPNREMADNNIFIFKDNKLYKENFVNHGLNMFSVDDNKLDTIYIAKGFFYNKANLRRNNSKVFMDKRKISNDVLLNNNRIPGYLNRFNKKFNFEFNITDTYRDNILRALNYVMEYNSGLMNRAYEKMDKTKSFIYTGLELKQMAKSGMITMSRRINGNINSYVVLFHNGELYKYYHELSYDGKNFTFPLKDVKNDDTMEILYFLEVDNRPIRIKFGSKLDDLYYLDDSINMNYMRLYTMQPEHLDFNIEIQPDKQYQIGFNYEKMDNGTYTIYPDNPFYYDKRLFLVSERQFRYLYIKCEYNRVDFILPEDFKFCDNKNQYMICVNGRRISNNNYRIIVPSPSTPFDDNSVYINMILRENDIVEIFYLPDEMKEIEFSPNLDTTGDIIVDKSKFKHNISKDLNFIFVNGKKIPRDWIYDVDQNRLKLTTDPGSVYNLSIIQHIKENELLAEMFENTTDLMTQIIDKLTIPEYKKIIQDINVSNKETDITAAEINMKYILEKIASDYYERPFINNGEDFLFATEDRFEDKDKSGSVLIDYDSNKTNKLGKEDNEYEA